MLTRPPRLPWLGPALAALLLAPVAPGRADPPAVPGLPAAPGDSQAAPAAPGSRSYGVLVLGSFGSATAARVERTGPIDSGAGVLVLLDGSTGAPLDASGLAYGPGPDLWAEYATTLDGLPATVRMGAMPSGRAGDTRLRVIVHVTVANAGEQAVPVHLAARLLPGGGDPDGRPVPSLAFAPGTEWTRDGDRIVRDGKLVLDWRGVAPEVSVRASPAAPDAEAAHLDWNFEVPPGEAALVELDLAGPPMTDVVDEAALRAAWARTDWRLFEERLGWQSAYHGAFADMKLRSAALKTSLVQTMSYLRILGDADKDIHAFSDRPFGHPASDYAVQAETLATFMEWNFGSWAVQYLHELLPAALERGRELPPARRLALASGLARVASLWTVDADLQAAAAAIAGLVTEPAEVAPWEDPAEIRDVLAFTLQQGGRDDVTLPELSWATVEPGSHAEQWQRIRRAVSAGDGVLAWDLLRPIVEAAGPDGLLGSGPEGTPSYTDALGLMNVVRGMLIGDRGQDLHMFPALSWDLVPLDNRLSAMGLPTRYGPQAPMVWFSGRMKILGASFLAQNHRVPRATLVHVPDGCVPAAIRAVQGGQVVLEDDAAMRVIPDGNAQVEWSVKLEVRPGY